MGYIIFRGPGQKSICHENPRGEKYESEANIACQGWGFFFKRALGNRLESFSFVDRLIGRFTELRKTDVKQIVCDVQRLLENFKQVVNERNPCRWV